MPQVDSNKRKLNSENFIPSISALLWDSKKTKNTENKIINLLDFHEESMKISYGKKKHYLFKIT